MAPIRHNRPHSRANRVHPYSRTQRNGRKGVVARTSIGSAAIHHSTSAGQFKHSNYIPRTLSAVYSKKGFVWDTTIGGNVTDANCIYIGHSCYPADRTLYVVLLALIRSLLRNVMQDLENVDSIIQTAVGFNNCRIEWVDGTNTSNGQDFSLSANPTVAAFANTLYAFFRGAIASNGRRYYTRIALTNGTGAPSNLFCQFNMAATKVQVGNSSYLKVQNCTLPADGLAPTEGDTTSCPIEGFSYFGKGNFTGLKEYINNAAAGDGQGFVPLEIQADPNIGVMTLRAANANINLGVAAPKEYANPPVAQNMKNVTGSAFNTLEPGTMKTDTLKCSYTMTFNQFLQGNYLNGYADTVDPSVAGQANRSRRGYFKLFALEKKLFSVMTGDPVNIRYEVNQFIRASVYIPRAVSSIQNNDPKGILNFVNS